MTDLTADALHLILDQQPFSHLVGVRLASAEPGAVSFELDLKPEHHQQHGFAHGGVVATLADVAISFAAGTVIGDLVTVEFKLNYLRPGLGETLIARGQVVSSTKRQAVCRADIFAVKDGTEKLIAAAQGTLAAVRKDATPAV
ncbi:MAG: PaaI family thioesterase [Pseudomonadota bacterium]